MIMARMDGLDALVGLGILGAMMDGESKGVDTDNVKQRMNERYGRKATPAEGAKAAKELYDVYVSVGFNEVQAFELLKLVLTVKR